MGGVLRISWRWLAIGVVILTADSSGMAQITDDFESSTPGSLPNSPWLDVTSRINAPTLPSPTGTVITTTGSDGATTQAYQIFNGVGTSAGILRPITPTRFHTVSADIRIDAQPDPYVFTIWTAAMGLLQDDGRNDFNNDPQVIVYLFENTWYYYVFNGTGPFGSFANEQLSPNPIVEGLWYHVQLIADTELGIFKISVVSEDGSFNLNRTVSFTPWGIARGQYDAMAFFDGEYSPAAVTGGQFTVDNVFYAPRDISVPATSTWGLSILSLLVMTCSTLVLRKQAREPALSV